MAVTPGVERNRLQAVLLAYGKSAFCPMTGEAVSVIVQTGDIWVLLHPAEE